MNENNNNFDELKQLLKLKRHEVPPPGYFNNFSGNVISRLRAGEAGGVETLADRLQEGTPWLINLLRLFEAKPGVIGGFAVSLCLVLVVGVVVADRPDSAPLGADAFATSQATSDAASGSVLASVVPAVSAADGTGIAVSANPVISLQPVAAGFSQQQNPLFQSASFMTSAH